MDPTKFNSAFENSLRDIELKQQADAEEAERQRIANDPAEREKAEASAILQSELQELGEYFIAKTEEYGISPTSIGYPTASIRTMGWEAGATKPINALGIDKDFFRIIVLEDGSFIEQTTIRPESDWPEGHYVRTNNKRLLEHMDKATDWRKRSNIRLHDSEREYRFVVENKDIGQSILDFYALSLGELLANLVSKKP